MYIINKLKPKLLPTNKFKCKCCGPNRPRFGGGCGPCGHGHHGHHVSPFGRGPNVSPFGPNVSPFGPNIGPNVSPFGPNIGPNVGGMFKSK